MVNRQEEKKRRELVFRSFILHRIVCGACPCQTVDPEGSAAKFILAWSHPLWIPVQGTSPMRVLMVE
jgi:hypothetical protein